MIEIITIDVITLLCKNEQKHIPRAKFSRPSIIQLNNNWQFLKVLEYCNCISECCHDCKIGYWFNYP